MSQSTLSEKQRELRKLTRQIRLLTRDINIIIDQHNSYNVHPASAEAWFESFPIQTLKESLEHDQGVKRTKFSLRHFAEKRKLRRLHQKKSEQLDQMVHQQNIAEIDVLLEKIKKAIKE